MGLQALGGGPWPQALVTYLHHPLPHWCPRGPTWGRVCPSLQRSRHSKRKACVPSRAFQSDRTMNTDSGECPQVWSQRTQLCL